MTSLAEKDKHEYPRPVQSTFTPKSAWILHFLHLFTDKKAAALIGCGFFWNARNLLQQMRYTSPLFLKLFQRRIHLRA
jgi:hypothetical protein